MPHNLFDVDDAASFSNVRDMRVGPASTEDVNEFARRWHYTATGGSAMWRYGLWDGFTLVGVVAYNVPTMETCASVFGPDHWQNVVHMGRLVCADDAPRNSESRLIAGSLKQLSVDRADTWGVLTYAATDQGHIGYVYQATNALYTGIGGDSHYFIDTNGARRSTYLDGAGVTITRANALGWTRMKGSGKHRYVYILGTRSQRRQRMNLLRLPNLPYPKDTTEGKP